MHGALDFPLGLIAPNDAERPAWRSSAGVQYAANPASVMRSRVMALCLPCWSGSIDLYQVFECVTQKSLPDAAQF